MHVFAISDMPCPRLLSAVHPKYGWFAVHVEIVRATRYFTAAAISGHSCAVDPETPGLLSIYK